MAKTQNIYDMLAEHLSAMSLGLPHTPKLVEILKANLTDQEARVSLCIPNTCIPLKPTSIKDMTPPDGMSQGEFLENLENLANSGMVLSGTAEDGSTGYCLLRVGFAFPQTFFWKGEDTPHARKMAKMVGMYFNPKMSREVHDTDPKPYRYIPVGQSIKNAPQGVLPHNLMASVIEKATAIALGHCPCRVGYNLAGRGCDHPTEVCMKFNDMARYVIDKGFAKEITKEEALEVIRLTEKEGLVHFVDNAEGEIQHNCNCCGCACWNVGAIRRRKIPRDALMATYFMRKTDEDKCIGCGACAEICPVKAVEMNDDVPLTDEEWCIGCGVCTTACPADAIEMVYRKDREEKLPARTFGQLHEMILAEKKQNDE
jgi:Fe-S-cluster-containing hydrogenase component 2